MNPFIKCLFTINTHLTDVLVSLDQDMKVEETVVQSLASINSTQKSSSLDRSTRVENAREENPHATNWVFQSDLLNSTKYIPIMHPPILVTTK